MKNAAETLRPDYPKDELAKGIWAIKIEKVALNLWRIRWHNLPTKDRLINRGMAITGECELCDSGIESTDHLFFGCVFAKRVLRGAFEASGSLIAAGTINSFEDAAREINKITIGSPAWGLQWNILGIVLFQIWKQRNQYRLQGRADTEQEVLKRSIKMAEIRFEEGRYKRRNKSGNEQFALLQWDALLMLIHEDDGVSRATREAIR